MKVEKDISLSADDNYNLRYIRYLIKSKSELLYMTIILDSYFCTTINITK